jgi:hypothetical protein
VSRLTRQCGILNISQPYRPPRPVTGIALLLLCFIFEEGKYNREIKKIVEESEKLRKIGMYRVSCVEDVENDLRELKLKKWK